LHAAQEAADVVAGDALVEELPEHLDPGHDRLRGGANADDLDLLANPDLAALDASRDDSAAAADREHVLDGHEERLVDLALWLGDVLGDSVHEFLNRAGAEVARLALERLERATADDRDVVAGELVLREQLAHLELDQVEKLLVFDHVDLVH